MITFLRIRNLATIEDLAVDLRPGFSVLTGETGAGKSMIIDSLRLLGGEKASDDLVRTGCPEATVEALIRSPGGAGEISVQRVIGASGKAYCDGVLVPLRKLREIVSPLVDIYGQNDHVFLLQIESHREYLDEFAGAAALRVETAQAAAELRRLVRLRDEGAARERERAQRLDFLEYQIGEIEKAGLRAGEEEELRAERELLKNAGRIAALTDEALALTYSEEGAITARLARLKTVLAELGSLDPSFRESAGSLAGFDVVLRDLAGDLMRARDLRDASPDRLDRIEERLGLLEGLKRKHVAGLEEILERLEGLRRERDELVRLEDTLERAGRDLARAFEAYRDKASALTRLRTRAAGELESLVEREIGQLGMKKARFRVALESPAPSPAEAGQARDAGADEVEFLLSPNPGEDVRPLRRIASGGELSRIMLALKSVGRERAEQRTMVFDEIDSGIGGRTAELVAQKLRRLGRSHQVLCVTHLPQIASHAAHHFRIDKSVVRDRTFTSLRELSAEERVDEIARLMAGSRLTEASRATARDMLRHNLEDGD